MITLPPSDQDLHAYVDGHLNEADREQLQLYLAAHPAIAAKVQAWQQDAQHLRAALSGALHVVPNPQLDPTAIRHNLRRQRRRHFATAALLLIAVSVGGVGGWQARTLNFASHMLPMADAVQAYRMFAVKDGMASDWTASTSNDPQRWLDQHFARADRIPDLADAGFKPVGGRMISTEQGAAAMLVYEDGSGRKASFYIRPPGPQHYLLARGARRDGELQADYWSSDEYNYALVTQADDEAAKRVRSALGRSI
ncbi:anti-sigma factor family protein [Pseudomonas turukhanskensis]|uniref:Regulator n=1 Tax=Pseudomonas turukhanskensis TaxID=1806536 RepID=A0A9W6K4F3_9PSED|nr:anti-sigma factor [Pseudomonas turukhanskensis]GLK89340.1 regulator [Pseudomonas turukhanskensis]